MAKKKNIQETVSVNVMLSPHEDDIHEKLKNDYYQTKLPYANSKKDKAIHEAYSIDLSRLEEEFKNDALIYHGLLQLNTDGSVHSKHPKADKVYSLAWSNGHSNGYSEVLNEMYDLADLVLND